MKKTLAMLLTLAMLFSLCACSNSDSQTTDPSGSSQSTTNGAENTTGSTEAPTDGTEGTTGTTPAPTDEPTTAPTDEPTTAPTDEPTTSPTQAPTETPTTPPTETPTTPPTTQPTTCSHSWKDATCTAPKTCETCGTTDGSANGHNWQDATCTVPKTCPVCKATEGTANGHSFTDGKCSVCNEVDPTFKALETGCWSIERYVDDIWVTHTFFFSSSGSWEQPFWHYNFMEPASDATVQDAIANGIDVEMYKHENGKYYILGGGDSGPATCTMDGDTITLSVYSSVITLKRTAGDQLTVEKYDGSLFVGNNDINIGDVFTWRECKHSFNDGKCSFCGDPQPNYKALDTGVWTGEEVVNGRLYKVKLTFKDSFFSASYGANIHDPSFDVNFRDQLLQDYENNKNALTVIDGVYYYTGSGDGGSITYTVNGNLIQADCDGWIKLFITRTAGNQLTITKCDEISNLPGIILTWQEG